MGAETCFFLHDLSFNQTPVNNQSHTWGTIITTFLTPQMLIEEECTNDFVGYRGIVTLQDENVGTFNNFINHAQLSKPNNF